MELVSGVLLQSMCEEKPNLFSHLLPELVKKLIRCSIKDINSIRIPTGEDIWAPGFDGVVECDVSSEFVPSGKSVWEFGAAKNTLEKINTDYRKRTKNALGINKKEASFYLVTPRVWAFNNQGMSITRWENSKRAWKSVRVYDGSRLADWINSEPSVCAWLFEAYYGTDKLRFSSVECAWANLSARTRPPLSPALFLNGRSNERDAFLNELASQSEIIRIKADARIDAVGFALSTLMQEKKYAEKCIVLSSYSSYAAVAEKGKGNFLLLAFEVQEELIPSENSVILCYNKEDISVKSAISLPLLSKSMFIKAVKEMGIEDSVSNDLFMFTHGNTRALIRRIPGKTGEGHPAWTSSGNISSLVPVVFLRSVCFETDGTLIEHLSQEKVIDIQKKYEDFLRIEDSPLKRVGNRIFIVDYEEAFAALNICSADPAFSSLHSAVLSFFTAFQGQDYWMNYQKLDARSSRIIRSLLFNYVYFSENDRTDKRLVEAVEELLPFLYDDSVSKFLLENLSLLAEAEPEIVIQFLESDFSKPDGITKKLFAESEYSSRYTSLLHALDELTRHEVSAIRACNLLFELCSLDIDYRLSNSPEESLYSAICFWNTSVCLNLQKKESILCKFIQGNPTCGIKLFIKMLKGESIFYASRLGAKSEPSNEITWGEILASFERVGTVSFECLIQKPNMELLSSLLGCFRWFPPALLERFSCRFEFSNCTDEELIKLNFKLRKLLYHQKKYHPENVDLHNDVLSKWIAITEPRDPVYSRAWLFYQFYECPYEDFIRYGSNEILIEYEKRKELRISELNALFQEHGTEVLKLLTLMENNYAWGEILAKSEVSSISDQVQENLLETEKYQLLCGFISSVTEENAEHLFELLPPQVQLTLLPSINRLEEPRWLDTPEKEHAYWSMKRLRNKNDNTSYQKLLIHHPAALINDLYPQGQSIDENEVKQIIDLFSELEKTPSEKTDPDMQLLEPLIDQVDKIHYSERWARACLELFKAGFINHFSAGICVFCFLNPDEYISLISQSRPFSGGFESLFVLPTQAYENYTAFSSFFDSLLNQGEQYYSIAGRIMGKSIPDSDGIFPHAFIRKYLEQRNERRLDQELFVGKILAQTFWTIGDGEKERIQAEKYHHAAIELELDYPHTAWMLRKLRDEQKEKARRYQIIAEEGYF